MEKYLEAADLVLNAVWQDKKSDGQERSPDPRLTGVRGKLLVAVPVVEFECERYDPQKRARSLLCRVAVSATRNRQRD